MVEIVLADDHQIVRQGLVALIGAEPDFKVVGEAGDGLEAVRLVEQLRPDVLVVDLMMPGITGLEVIRRVQGQLPATRVIVLSMYDDESYVTESFRNGASGYVLKGDSVSDLVKAVREVMNGNRFLSSPLSEVDIDRSLAERKSQDPYDSLTRREREVMQLTAEGLSSTEIAARLSISSRTVETHRANMMHKLKLANHVELIRFAIKHGVLPKE